MVERPVGLISVEELVRVLPDLIADALRERDTRPPPSSQATLTKATGVVVNADDTTAEVQLDEDGPGVLAQVQLANAVSAGDRVVVLMSPGGSAIAIGNGNAQAAAGGDADLVFAKQMYGTANDPGGGAPTDPWSSSDNDYGGIFSKTIDDPSVDDGGWISVNLKGLRSGLAFGVDPNLDWGSASLRVLHSGANSSADLGMQANTTDPDDGVGRFVMNANAASGSPRSDATWASEDVSGDYAIVTIDCEHLANSPSILLQQNFGGVASNAAIYTWAGDPNGNVNGPVGSLCMDTVTPALWLSAGASTWTQLT